MKNLLSIVIILCLFPTFAAAETLQFTKNTSLHFEVPAGWQWAKEAPQMLLDEFAEHIGHEAEAKGHSPSREQLLDAARKRLKANEILLYNPQSSAYMTIDLSPLRQGERPPSKKTIKLSAKYAGESLEQEEGVSQVEGNTEAVEIDGAWYAYRYNADYRHHDEKMFFSGIIGFSSPNWFFFYYTDYLRAADDKLKAEQVFKSIRIESRE